MNDYDFGDDEPGVPTGDGIDPTDATAGGDYTSEFTEYVIRVPYTWSTCCNTGESDTEITLYAKSPEHARHLAKRAVEGVSWVSDVYSTTIVSYEEP